MSDWITAAFGLAGVVVGGALNGAITTVSERRRDDRAGRSAARLVLDELNAIGSITNGGVKAGVYGPEVLAGFPRSEWEEHRSLLADVLTSTE
jgi:hypothetical protein